MNARKKAILTGMILGDAFLQKTGRKLEHSQKQKEYIIWKAHLFPEYFQGSLKELVRYNPVYKKEYHYVRWQSNSSPVIGQFHRMFYIDGKKIIPKELPKLLTTPESLAVWYMDDGYLSLDKMAYIYLPKYTKEEQDVLLFTLKENFGLEAKIIVKKRGESVLRFTVSETQKLIALVDNHIIPSMQYKRLKPRID
ncbi:MAG: hypothetical protein ACE5DQ_01775 [Candidatus Paceibacterota bacterium]